MKLSQTGIDLIKSFEGFEAQAYLCPAKVWTIGYGSTGPHVRRGMKISHAEAEELLRRDARRFDNAVQLAAPDATKNQHDAMVSLAFNIGIDAFRRSTVLRRHIAKDHKGAADAFAMWNKGGGAVLAGLTRRRAAEAALYRKAAP